MATSIQTIRAAVAAHYADVSETLDEKSLEPSWGETAVTVAATAIAVVVVAFIAVLMGLA